MKIRDIIVEKKEPPKPRNFVAKNAKMGGAGAHKDKKKAAKQGNVKHKKKEIAENTDWLKGKEELNLKYYDHIYVENTNNGVLVHGEDIEGGYADQDGGERSGYFSFVANLNTGKIDLDYDDYNDSNNSYADSDSMEDIVRDILGDIKREYGSTWEEITSELQGGFGIDESQGRQNFEVLGYKYITDIDEEEDNRKIWHTLVSPEGKSHTVDWSPYSYMSPKDVKFYIKLGMPKRVDSGPLDTDKLVKMAQMKGIANLDPELANAGKGVEESNGEPDIKPGMRVSQGTVVKVNGNTVIVKTSNGDMMTMNIHDIDQGVAERVKDPEDWDEGNTEPPNNFAVYINGKKWKVFKGRGQYADDAREKQHYYQLKDWAAKKTAATGKKWEVAITGEPATESIAEKAPAGFKGTVKAMKKHKDIDNPFALAWSMKNKGYKSHKKADGSDK